MKFRTVISSLVLTFLTSGLSNAGDSPDQKREKTRKMADAALRICISYNPPPRTLSRSR
jgi:hypothetical protein